MVVSEGADCSASRERGVWKERRWFARGQVRERRADYGQRLSSRPRNAPATTTRGSHRPSRKADDAFRFCDSLPPNHLPHLRFADLVQQSNSIFSYLIHRCTEHLSDVRTPLLPQAEMRMLVVVVVVPELATCNLRLHRPSTLRGVRIHCCQGWLSQQTSLCRRKVDALLKHLSVKCSNTSRLDRVVSNSAPRVFCDILALCCSRCLPISSRPPSASH